MKVIRSLVRKAETALGVRKKPQVVYRIVELPGLLHVTVHAVDTGEKLGWLYVELLKKTKTNYVIDIVVLDEYRGFGLGSGLLRHAATVSPYKSFALVSVCAGAIPFWAHIATSKAIDLRLGLVNRELTLMRGSHYTRDNVRDSTDLSP